MSSLVKLVQHPLLKSRLCGIVFPSEVYDIPRWSLKKFVISLQLYFFISIRFCFDYFQTMFLPSEVKPWIRTLFPQLVLTILCNPHPGCDLAECWLYPSWFCLVIPSDVCLFCQHILDNIHTYIMHSWIKSHFSFAFINNFVRILPYL